MSVINYRRSVNGSNDQLGRRYLSDSLTPWWGSWAVSGGTLGISYNNLPSEPGVLAKVTNTINAGSQALYFSFNNNQNLKNYLCEFWVKGSDISGGLDVFVNSKYGAWDYSLNRMRLYLYAPGTFPTLWTKVSVAMSSLITVIPGFADSGRYDILSRVKTLAFYTYSATVFPFTTELAGVNFRRL